MCERIVAPSIDVGGLQRTSLSLVTVRIGNAGNEAIEGAAPELKYNTGASVLYIKPRGDLGAYQKCVSGSVEPDKVVMTFTHINPGADYEFELLFSDYEPGSLTVDVAAPGVTLLRRNLLNWGLPISSLQSVGLSFFGVRYDPQVGHMAEIAAELRALRKMLQKK